VKKNEKGFGVVEILVVLVIVGLIGTAGWLVYARQNNKTDNKQSNTQAGQQEKEETTKNEAPQELIWQQAENGWRPTQTPPACPNQPIMKSPVDLSKVTSILYPGQTRGGNYKPHGGFRLDGTANEKVTVTAPIDGFIVRGGHYLAEGEIQYTFDVMNNCGVMYRVGHFRTLPEKLQNLTTSWPAALEGDSRTHSVSPAVFIKQGEVLATSVGIIKEKNTFFDWGVYDYRQANEASKSTAYQQAHAQDKELSWHAVCWFDWLSASDSTRVKSLPAGDPTSAKNSDYCK
jgi:type II secretory pathway pseudopilin PulG